MLSPSDDRVFVPMRHGPVLPLSVIRWLCDLADTGLTVRLEPSGKVLIGPRSRVQPSDVEFIRVHRHHVVAALNYIENGIACTCDTTPTSCSWHQVSA